MFATVKNNAPPDDSPVDACADATVDNDTSEVVSTSDEHDQDDDVEPRPKPPMHPIQRELLDQTRFRLVKRVDMQAEQSSTKTRRRNR